MMQLKDRVSETISILKQSNKELETDPQADGTGFLSFKPEALAETIHALSEIYPPPAKVLDLGCGNGGFALLAAAAGYDVYAIEIHPFLLEKAKENAKKASLKIRFAQGNFYPAKYKDDFLKFRNDHRENEKSMPWEDTEDPYAQIGISLSEIDIIYTWSWPTQSRFLFNFLEKETSQKTIFVLPAYVRYTQGEHMNAFLRIPNKLILQSLREIGGTTDIFIGKKV